MSTPGSTLDGTLPEQQTDRVELLVGGMTCAACATRIEKKLNKLEGVHATVNYASERALVEGASAEDAIAVVKKAGYTAMEATGDDSELGRISEQRVRTLRLRLAVAAVLTIPLGNLAIVLALVPSLRFPMWEWLCVALAVPVVFWSAWPFHVATWRNLRNRSFSMDTLVSLGVLSAFSWSLISIIWRTPDTEGYWLGYGITPAGADAIYFEVAAAVTTFLLAGRYFEARARRSAQGVLGALNQLAPKQVRRLADDGTEELVPVATLRAGDRFRTRSGERFAADGTVLEGSSAVDTSMMTGEPVPVEVGPEAAVLGGTVNVTAPLVVRATRVGAHTQLAQMAALAEQAQLRKAKVQQLVDRVVGWFVPAVLLIAAITLIGWFGTGHGVRSSVSAALSVLIIACPCALGLATPTALMVGVGRGGQLGILIKTQEALEASGAVDTVVFDKTGTITEGALTLESVHAVGELPEARVRLLAAAVEGQSDHPLARAIAGDPTVGELPVVSQVETPTGQGATGVVDGQRVVVGNEAMLADYRVAEVPQVAAEIVRAARDRGATPVLVAVDGAVVGVHVLTDRVRPSAAEAVRRLQARGLRTVLLTGDHEQAAAAVAAQVGMDDFVAGVLPARKAEAVAELQAAGHQVAMVGDGINDAAALATANLGLAMVSGTDIAMKSADVILVRENLNVVPDAINLSRATLRTIRGNLIWAFGYNCAAIPLAAAGLLNPLIAGLAMSLSSLFVVANSLRLRSRSLG
ncbi:copper-translocating P-type ATPase [Enemella evansiae]|uniref:heavy metal translocating P-type ATPase n=1 Tax=Enemella evansiae TaxID=2016499 RepID=UPI000B965CE0|nr:heavy metal translocating P-type ATPase [Enemella evansiae]OYO20534.1 copper-translocating P-type ATPase [Enemella evansiae]